MERQFREDRSRFKEKQHLSKKEKQERRRRKLVKARNAVALVAIASTVTAAEYAITSQMPQQHLEPSCFALKVECPWPLSTPTPIHSEPTHVLVPKHEVTPSVNQHIR